ncbi:hypothetical protein GJ631_16605 [Natronomonas sp. CBA1123]|jgi:hypothetical protein|uniref:hypothetical protein n=1 Tax=Natronomonas sp. CBA1123 TaxID=2668070 RepID=UPI0012EA4DA8|nr:hypothetical protein [Natronomonas sp. CBA1123]MUV88129.1 hypothetical protein [Natronomonas sp. CBA1123]
MVGVRFDNGERVIERWDEVFKAVSTEPRRQLLVSLLDAEPNASVPLPEAAINPNVPVEPERLRTELFHAHLPMLTRLEFVEWERDPLRASRGPRFEEVAVVFESLHAMSDQIPDSLVIGCQRLEAERQDVHSDG